MEGIKLLLQFDHDGREVSTVDTEDYGILPLCNAVTFSSLDIVKYIFDLYPEAIYETSLDNSRYCRHRDVLPFLQSQIELEHQARVDTTPDHHGQLPIHRALQNEDISVGTIKLMTAAYPVCIRTTDNQGCIPLHIACQVGCTDAAKYLLEINEHSLKMLDTRGNLALHHACMAGKCDIISCILEKSIYGATLQNHDKRTPIELLLFEAVCDRSNMDYVEAIRCLFQVNPVDTLKRLANNGSYAT